VSLWSAAPHAAQELFPGSFEQLVRVYNHKAVDKLLGLHEGAATHRDHAAAALADAQQRAKAGAASAGGSFWERRAASKRAGAEPELAAAQDKVAELEAQIEAARAAALSQPLGTAFIALFKWARPVLGLDHLARSLCQPLLFLKHAFVGCLHCQCRR
jgi:hypothetical protein